MLREAFSAIIEIIRVFLYVGLGAGLLFLFQTYMPTL